jgi:hypothetical protein
MDAPSQYVSLVLLAVLPTASLAGVDPRGPIANPGINPVVDAEGVHSPGFKFDPATCRKPSPWQAKWIWLPVDRQTVAATAFRKEVAFAEAPKHVAAWLSADVKYRLYVNGRLAARGPVDIGTDYAGGSTERWFYDYRDLTQFFHKGQNTIAVEVFHRWPIGFTVSRGHAGLIFEAEAVLPNGSKRTIASDTTWNATPAEWFTAEGGLTYCPGREPPAWQLSGFDDSRWSPCEVTKDLWTPLIPSEIPPLMEARYPILRIENVRGGVKVPADAAKTGRGITVTGDGNFTVVFDRVLSAYPTLKLKGGKGARVTMHACRQSQMVLGGGEQCYEWPFMDEIAPAFTVSFSGVTEPIVVEDVGANFTSQPVDYLGSFTCSDEKLNKIWKASRWAVQICMQTHHLDSPNHQEPICDPGDYVIEAQVSYYAFGQPWLARQDIRKFAWLLKNEKYRNFHTSYSLYWLEMLMDYTTYTGDSRLKDEMRPYVFELMDTYLTWVGKNGLISEAPNYMFMDWVDIGGFNCHHPPAVIGQGYLTALFVKNLAYAECLAYEQHDRVRAEKYLWAASHSLSSFNRELWDVKRRLYRDGKPFLSSVKSGKWLPADKDIETNSPHVNLLAVLSSLAPKDERQAIVERIMSQPSINTQPWFMHWVFAAVNEVGLFDKYGTQQLRRWEVLPETQSFREMWHGGDVSHGWCSTPLVQMSSMILGVRPGGTARVPIAVEPRFCDLAWAKGTVPTSKGLVTVSWKAESGKYRVDLTVPATTEWWIPASFSGWTAKTDAKLVYADNGIRIYEIRPGTHHLELRRGKTDHE